MTHGFANAQLALRAAGGGTLFVLAGHFEIPFVVIIRESGWSSIPWPNVFPGLLDAPLEPVIGLAEDGTRCGGARCTILKPAPVRLGLTASAGSSPRDNTR
jgi:hypothetical protein